MRDAAKELADDSVGKDKELLLPGDTRFGTHVLMAGQLFELKEAVQDVVNSIAKRGRVDHGRGAKRGRSDQAILPEGKRLYQVSCWTKSDSFLIQLFIFTRL